MASDSKNLGISVSCFLKSQLRHAVRSSGSKPAAGPDQEQRTSGDKPQGAVNHVWSCEEEKMTQKQARSTKTSGVLRLKDKTDGREGGRDREEDEEKRGRRDRQRGGAERRTVSEGGEGEEWRRLRGRVNQLEKEKLQLTTSHNQEVCGLQTELTRLRSAVERAEAQGAELQYQRTISLRDSERLAELSRDKRSLTERVAELQQTVDELQKVLDVMRRARDEDQHALQQEVEERDQLIQSFSGENQRLHQLLQEQEEALEEAERRMKEVQMEKEKEAELNRRQKEEVKYLKEKEERSRREKEGADQKAESLEASVEAERAAHLESRFSCEVLQLRVRDLEAAVAVERSGQQEAQCSLELLRAQFRELERVYGLERERSGELERVYGLERERSGELERVYGLERERSGELERVYGLERERSGELERVYGLERERSGELERVYGLERERSGELERVYGLERERSGELERVYGLERERSGELERVYGLERERSGELERVYGLERERSGATERTLERLQAEHAQSQSDMRVAMETERKATSDLLGRLEEEKLHHADTRSRLEQAAKRQSDTDEAFLSAMNQIRDALKHHGMTSHMRSKQPAQDDGKSTLPEVLQLLTTTLDTCRGRLEDSGQQVQDLMSASQNLQQLSSDQRTQIDDFQQTLAKLEKELARLHQESSDWSMQNRGLKTELQKERAEREKEKEETAEEIQKMVDHYEEESKDRLLFFYCLYQRLLAGCVLMDQPQSILGNFTWKELCDVISEQVEQLASDLQKANQKVTHLKSVCKKKSARVRELQHSQECALSRLENMRRREEVWSQQHTQTVEQLQTQLQLCRSELESLQDHSSSLECRCSSLTSDLSRLQDDLSRRRRESSSFFTACALLAGVLRHTHCRLHALSEQKRLLSRRLEERELLEEEVRRLADALEGEKDKEQETTRRRRMVRRRWRRSVGVVLALRRWSTLSRNTTVLFWLEKGGGRMAVCGCSALPAAKETSAEVSPTDEEGSCEGLCAHWLWCRHLSSIILSSMSDLQGGLVHPGSASPNLTTAARSAMSRLLDHVLDQSEFSAGADQMKTRPVPPLVETKNLATALQQHFLLFSQRLHATEVERRGLRLQVANLRRGLKQEKKKEETSRTVAAEHFQSVCEELHQALSREQEAQTLIQEQSDQRRLLQQRIDKHTSEETEAQLSLIQNTQVLSDALQEVSRKERSLRILGKHLSGVQREKRQLEERLHRAEDELRDTARRQEFVIRCMKTAETSCRQVRDDLVQSKQSLTAKPRPLLLPREYVEMSGAESIMGSAEAAACQSFLSIVSQLCLTCLSTVAWLQQEVSAHRSHVTALRSELQDACLRGNQVFVPVEEFPEAFDDAENPTLSPAPNT